MDLRKRLAQLDRLTRKSEPAPIAGRVSDEERDARLRDLGLIAEQGPAGRIWVRERLDAIAPPDPLPDFRELFPRWSGRAQGAADLLFLDAETTGLAGGTGTVAFLLGMSRYRDGLLHTRQLLLSSPAQEPALLSALAEWAADAQVTVTFNGASFDLPLLRTRCLLNRRDDPLAELEGWDLLVPSRRLWSRRLDDCRQQTLERAVCRLPERTGDIDGQNIPAAWFDFLAAGRTDALDRVLHHNHLDMLGMAHLLQRVGACAQRLAEPPRAGLPAAEWRDLWSLGRIGELRRDVEVSVAWMREAFLLAGAQEPEPRFLVDAVRILKRGGDWPLVERVLRWAQEAGRDEPWLAREAAILYERRLPDLEKALDHAGRSGETARVQRLRRKLGLDAGSDSDPYAEG